MQKVCSPPATPADCGDCCVPIRFYLDKTFPQLLWQNVSGFFSVKAH